MTMHDPFLWLENAESAATTSWLAMQDTAYKSAARGWRRSAWRDEVERLDSTSSMLRPSLRGPREFFRIHHAGAEHPVLYVREKGQNRALFDPITFDGSGETVLEKWDVSPEGDLIACQVSERGLEDTALLIVDVESGRIVEGPIDRLRRSSIAWLPAGKGFYYVRRLPPELHPGEERYHRRVYYHEIGAGAAHDALVFGDGGEKTAFYSVSISPDGHKLAVTVTKGSSRTNSVWLADIGDGSVRAPRFKPLAIGDDARTEVCFPAARQPSEGSESALWLVTDWKAPRGRLLALDDEALSDADTARRSLREIVSERGDAVLEEAVLLDPPGDAHRFALLSWKRHALAELTLHDAETGALLDIVDLPDQGTVGPMATRPEGGSEAWFAFTTFSEPVRILRYDCATRVVDCPFSATENVPGAASVKSQLITFESADGTEVRMFILSTSGGPDRPRPAILTGYGGFGVSMEPSFQPHALAWVLAGGVYAVACLRGGGEEGEDWHRAGMGANKTKVFEDFEAAAVCLARQGWTSPTQLAVTGGSNGGLLVAAALTRFPERFAAVVCSDALLDMLRYERFGLGPSWVPEYGSAEDAEQLAVLQSYSPYHHVQHDRGYPPVLFTAGVTDTRVDPVHTRKMLARLQQADPTGGPFLLRLEHDAGHGARSRSKYIDLIADQLAFLGAALGLETPMPTSGVKQKNKAV